MALGNPKMHDQQIERRGTEARVLLNCDCEVCHFQLCGGRHFLHGHPAGARSWADAQVVALLGRPAVGSAVGDQCLCGQKAQVEDGSWLSARTATRWMSSVPRG